MRVLLINNLSSGSQDGAIYDFMRAFTESGDELVLRSFDSATSCDSYFDDVDEFDLVVAAGGDGTVACVADRLKNTGIPILPFPAGTSNAVHMNLRLPEETHALAKVAREGNLMDFDMGIIETATGRHGFLLVAGCGYDATIMASAKETKTLLGPMAYFQAAITNPTPTYSHFVIEMDGKTIERDGLGVMVANFSKMQFDLPLAPQNRPRDGHLDVIVLTTSTAFGLIPQLLTSMLDREGTHNTRSNGLEVYRAESVHVTSTPELTIQYDGEPTGEVAPFSAHVVPDAIRFVVTEETMNLYPDSLSE